MLLLLVFGACDRKVEPFVPGEQPAQPDLRKIFPPGAEQAAKSAGPMGQAPTPDRGGSPAAAEEAASAAPVRGSVSLAPEVAARAPAGAILFVIARRGAGGPPLAVKRIESPRFPVRFEIGPGDRMIQTMPFVGPMQLTARLDGDGNATTRTAGDLQGAAQAPVDPGAENVEIVLGEVL
jgi:hypothetical protein